MKEVNIFLGRFQPFTNGHLKAINYGKSKNGLGTVLLILKSNSEDKRHPFNESKNKIILDKLKNTNVIIDYIYIDRAAFSNLFNDILKEHNYIPYYWICGEDRAENYGKIYNRYIDSIDNNKFKILTVPRTDEDISATKVRNAIHNNDIVTFKMLVPEQLWSLYDYMKSQIDYNIDIKESFENYLNNKLLNGNILLY